MLSHRLLPTRKHLLVRYFSVKTGTVKFYLREKGYGFIQPDGGGADCFVHRSGLVSDVPTDVSLQHPFLRKGERVRYEAIPDTGLDKATQVTWLNGQPIPPLRRNYLGSVHERARRVLGDHAYAIFADDTTSDEEKNVKIRDAFIYAHSIVENGQALIQRLGMKIEDFPTEASDKPGRYQFTSEEEKDEAMDADDDLHSEESPKV